MTYGQLKEIASKDGTRALAWRLWADRRLGERRIIKGETPTIERRTTSRRETDSQLFEVI